jgi:tetratricopeptide (TPR) repeat protein
MFLLMLPLAVLGQMSKAEKKARKALADDEPYKVIRICDHQLLEADAPLVFRVLRADALNRIGRYAKALDDANMALAALPGDPHALLQSGIAYGQLGPVDSAFARLRAAREAAVEGSMYTEASVRLAMVYQQAQRTSLARMALEQPAGRANTHDADARVFRIRGECAAMEGDSATARKDLDRAIELAPRDPVAWNSRGFFRYAHFGEHQRAIQDFDRAIKFNPNYGYAFNNRGWSYYKLGNKEKALKDISLAARKNKHNAYAYRNLGVIALESGDPGAACDHFRQALAEGFTLKHGMEVEELMEQHCGGVPSAPSPQALPGNAPGNAPANKPVPRTNAP